MGADRLFLVRRDNREFIGPMPIHDFKHRIARMDFGMQDEVSGNCGPWVVLDRKEELNLHYPEIVGLLGDSLPLSWRETTGHARVISRHESRRDRSKKSRDRAKSKDGLSEYLERQQRKSRLVKQLAFGLIVSAALVALFIVLKKEEVPPVSEMAGLAAKSDPTDFLNAMGVKVIPVASRFMKSQKSQAAWLPMLRMYAFYTTGSVDGVSQKILKGELPASAPQDCAVESWKRKWRENAGQTTQFLQGKSIQKNPWTKILALDPAWVKRRPAKGWLKPRNYYEGCLMTASLAIRSMASDPSLGADSQDGVTPDVIATVSRRLQSQLEFLTTGKISSVSDKSSVMGALTCLETQSSVLELEACKASMDPVMKPLFDERHGMALLRLATTQITPNQGATGPDAKWTTAAQGLSGKFLAEDFMSRADQAAEVKLMGYLLGGMAVDQAVGKTEQESGDIRFK